MQSKSYSLNENDEKKSTAKKVKANREIEIDMNDENHATKQKTS